MKNTYRWFSFLYRFFPAMFCGWALTCSDGTFAAKPEMRGVCVQSRQIRTRKETDKWVARVDAAHLNTVIVEVWYHGRTQYRSDLCPMAANVEPGHAPLGYLIQKCHRRGIEVHAWFVSGSVASSDSPVLREHPDWRVDGDVHPWYDLGKPEVRKFESDLMIEALRKYDLDGLLFDDGATLCYGKHCQDEFAGRYGCKPFLRPIAFPFAAEIRANAVGGPTTAKVLATFSNGIPAIAINELDRGSHGDIYFDLNYLDRPISEALVSKYYPTKAPTCHPPARPAAVK